jgi:hypothetical protein
MVDSKGKVGRTPGPWRANFLHEDGFVIKRSGWEISTPDYDVCANIEGGAPIRKAEDAEFIVRACNSYDELVDACRSALDVLPHVVKFLKFQSPGREFWPNREAGEAAISRLETALKKATEGEGR